MRDFEDELRRLFELEGDRPLGVQRLGADRLRTEAATWIGWARQFLESLRDRKAEFGDYGLKGGLSFSGNTTGGTICIGWRSVRRAARRERSLRASHFHS